MDYHLLHTVTGILCTVFLANKVILHCLLDRRVKSGSAFLFSPLQYLRPYRKTTADNNKVVATACNVSLMLAVLMLVLNGIIGIMIYVA